MPFPPHKGDRVIEIHDFPGMDTGDPSPELRVAGGSLILSYRQYEGGKRRVKLAFKRVLAQYFGWPGDEALSAHRLYASGVGFYGVYEVIGSSWLQSIKVANRTHPSHIDSNFDAYRHFVVTFHDETFECIAVGYDVSLTESGS
jgi:hypothetical protein